MGKLDITYVDEIIRNNNLKRIGEYVNNCTPILCIDENGYKVFPTIQHLRDGKKPRPFFKKNPYTIENIRLYLTNNSPDIELLSEKYIASDSKLSCKCKIDGFIWDVSWEGLKSGQRCPRCKVRKVSNSNKNTLEEIQDRLSKLNNHLSINDNKYYGCLSDLNISCDKGHHFKRNWIELLNTPFCPICVRMKLPGGYNFVNAERNKEKWLNKNAIVYIVNMYDSNENFYKIGITNRSIDQRLQYKTPYNYTVISEIPTNMYDATYIENELHYHHRDNQYCPLKDFFGKTECFKDIDMNIINKYELFYKNFNRNFYERHHMLIFKKPINLNVCSDKELKLHLISLNAYLMSAKDLGMNDFEISGYSVTSWIKDIKSKLEISELKKQQSDLKAMEQKLDKLLSDDKKTELELDDIAALLKLEK